MKNEIKDYLNKSDWRVKENSNISYSLSGLHQQISGKAMAEYTLNEVYDEEIRNAHLDGYLHLHDLDAGIAPYCAGWSLEDILMKGFGGVKGVINSTPPKHFDTALLQVVNFLGTLQNEWAGAQAINSADVLLAPFVRNDELTYSEIKQGIQKFIFNLNVTSRWANQTPFTNITLDWEPPRDLHNQAVVIGGELRKNTYDDYRKEIKLINKALLEVYKEGDANGRPFTFPIPTYNITDDFDWENSITDLLFEVTSKYGLPYFSNFMNSDLNPRDVRSLCCRLQLDNTKLKKNVTGGLFGSSDKTGSLGVVTINIPKIGYLSKDEDEYFERLDDLLSLAKRSLQQKRGEVEKNLNRGLLPHTKEWLPSLDNHFSTIGLVGMNEGVLNLIGENIVSDNGRDLTNKTLDFILDRVEKFTKETGYNFNLEATPAEGTSYKLAKLDRKMYKDIITSGESTSYYTNSTQIPVDAMNDVFEQVEIEEPFQTKYTGGTIFHTFLGERIAGDEAKILLRKLLRESKMPYITLTPTYSICPNHNYIAGEHYSCPKCGTDAEVYSRVVGYYRPVNNWNKGKQEEYQERSNFDVQLT